MTRLRLFITAVLAMLVAASGPASADFETGFAAYSQGDYATALREWQALAEQGDPRAQVGLGFMHEKGLGVPQDHTKAVRWYRSGSEQGDAIAEYNLAVMYGNGTGVLRDYVKAFALFSLSSGHGNTEAANSLAYIERLMTPLEVTEAKDLLTLAGEDSDNATRIVLSDDRQSVPPAEATPVVAAAPPVPPTVVNPVPAPAPAVVAAPDYTPAPAPVAPAPVVAAPVVAEVAYPSAKPVPALAEVAATPAPVEPAPAEPASVVAVPAVAEATPAEPAPNAPAPAVEIAIRPAAQAAVAAPAASTQAPAWRVHMASLRSEAAAVTEWQRIKQRHSGELGDMKLTVEPVDLPEKGRFYRVLAGPIVDKAKADQLCAILTAGDQYCRAMR